MVLSGHGGHDCLELPSGAAALSETVVGDHLLLEADGATIESRAQVSRP